VGRKGVITLEESRGVDNDLYVVEGPPPRICFMGSDLFI